MALESELELGTGEQGWVMDKRGGMWASVNLSERTVMERWMCGRNKRVDGLSSRQY